MLLAAAAKGGDKRAYAKLIRTADERFTAHLAATAKEGKADARQSRRTSLDELSPKDREEVERGARNLLIESRTLRALRKALGVTQDQLADALETTQGNVAQIESKRDVMVSTVTRIVNALGGDLHLIATFPGRRNAVRISIVDDEIVEAQAVRARTRPESSENGTNLQTSRASIYR